jgi:maltose alpha-D-glucosyltransferase/alpha-amylase
MNTLGKRTGALHEALARETDEESFKPEIITNKDWQQWSTQIKDSLKIALKWLKKNRQKISERLQPQLDKLLNSPEKVLNKLDSFLPEGSLKLTKTRHHGDLHLGQVLLVSNDFIFIDFEGEPARPLSERCQKHCPLRDVAGMMRSFSYAAETARRNILKQDPEISEHFAIDTWEKSAKQTFLQGYREEASSCSSVPENESDFNKILSLFMLEKALYELEYEKNNRPEWIEIPIAGLFECFRI